MTHRIQHRKVGGGRLRPPIIVSEGARILATEREVGLEVAIDRIGGIRALARLVNRSSATVAVWTRIPVEHVLTIERAIQVPREELRPDIYPPEDRGREMNGIEENEPVSKRYTVTWRVELMAPGPNTAARMAQDIQRDPNNTATIFEVSDGEESGYIDLHNLPQGIFRDHACWKCKNGANPCVNKDARRCPFPHARND